MAIFKKIKDYFRLKKEKFNDINEMFYYRYHKRMFNKEIMVVLRNGDILKGVYNAFLPEVESIQIGSKIVKIEEIDLIKLIK